MIRAKLPKSTRGPRGRAAPVDAFEEAEVRTEPDESAYPAWEEGEPPTAGRGRPRAAAGAPPDDAEAEAEIEGPSGGAPLPDPVPEGARDLIELFRGPLAGVRFPDVDRDVLEAAGEALRAADTEVNRLFTALETAQVRLSERRAELTRLAERGLAYARVFAAEDEALLGRVETIDLGAAKKPGRKPKEPGARGPGRPRRPRDEGAGDTTDA